MEKISGKTKNEIRSGWEVGYDNCNLYIWQDCLKCGTLRWVGYSKKKGISKAKYCNKCCHLPEVRFPDWKCKRYTDKDGYVRVRLNKSSPYFPMVNRNGYVLENRLIMAKYLGRCLKSWERVSFIDGTSNDISNLKLHGCCEYHDGSSDYVIKKKDIQIDYLMRQVAFLSIALVLFKTDIDAINKNEFSKIVQLTLDS